MNTLTTYGNYPVGSDAMFAEDAWTRDDAVQSITQTLADAIDSKLTHEDKARAAMDVMIAEVFGNNARAMAYKHTNHQRIEEYVEECLQYDCTTLGIIEAFTDCDALISGELFNEYMDNQEFTDNQPNGAW